ncbi:Rdx family-domain-containing protein [Staphylotrichum tortipilum]|uniref:Guanine nucleotide-binding protein subunit gamma n=1 Tax=Staphylotrichum tortipilum TaxID=2831512 RepID=A0AAN6MG31_9PEZI|nr:Rdx family-domain-containing protein [Staphylotrichum longicolle]
MPQYTSRDVGDPSQIKKNKQSMADLKLRRLTELNSRLREDLDRERIPVSQASKSIIAYCNSTRDYMVPTVWGPVPKGEDPYAPQQSGGCSSALRLPRVTIQFCTQCKWMLRAAYFAQELLSTFSTALGEVALQPATGGVFVIEITTSSSASVEAATTTEGGGLQTQTVRLWDRKTDGGFPETKELKRRVRDVVAPGRDLGHVDRNYPREGSGGVGGAKEKGEAGDGKGKVCKVGEKGLRCEDCE